jgi:tetracycline resistance efflux pump
MSTTWIVLLPPVFVLGCAALSHNVIVSLVLGIASAALIATNFTLYPSLILISQTLYAQAVDTEHLYLFLFLMILGFVIEMMTNSGGIKAYTKLLHKHIKDQRSTESTSLMLSSIFFLDDYMGGLTVGAIMRPLTDSVNIPRAKLAFLINSVSSPLCVLIPASTWVALILGQLEAAGVSDIISDKPKIFADPLFTYLSTIPFIFYAIFMMISTWLIVRKKISFGAMHEYETIARSTSNLFGGKEPRNTAIVCDEKEGTIAGFLIPLGTFLTTMIFCIFYSGNASILGGINSLGVALKETDSFWSLFMASSCSAIVSIIYFNYKKLLSLKEIINNAFSGFSLTKTSIIVLYLAYVFSAILINELHAGDYLAQVITGILPLPMLPLVVFLLSTVITAGTGSSWSTIAVMLPLTINMLIALTQGALPLTPDMIPQFFATLGALIAGSVAGSQFSPITDSSIMASTAAGAYLMDHVQTQITYSIPALIGSCITFLLIGLFSNHPTIASYGIAAVIGLSTTIGILLFRNKNR